MAGNGSGVIWFTGLSGAGKSTLARATAERLATPERIPELLDGDLLRARFPNTGFSPDERDRHVRRAGELARDLEQQGHLVVAALISPFTDARDYVRAICHDFLEVYVSTPIEECERRDPKQLYARARRGEVADLTGIGSPYEPPSHPDVTVDTTTVSVEDAVSRIVAAWHARQS